MSEEYSEVPVDIDAKLMQLTNEVSMAGMVLASLMKDDLGNKTLYNRMGEQLVRFTKLLARVAENRRKMYK